MVLRLPRPRQAGVAMAQLLARRCAERLAGWVSSPDVDRRRDGRVRVRSRSEKVRVNARQSQARLERHVRSPKRPVALSQLLPS